MLLCASVIVSTSTYVSPPQALSLKETEKAALSERLSTLQAELSTATLELERLTWEAAHAKELERVKPDGGPDAQDAFVT